METTARKPVCLAVFLILVLGAGCSSGEPVDPGPVPTQPAGPRTLQFVRVETLGSRNVLDIDLGAGGRAAALVAAEGTPTAVELWTTDGLGWTSGASFTSNRPQCVALEPGGSRIFVGHKGGFRILEPGQPSPSPTRFELPTEFPGISQVYSDPARECRWRTTPGGATVLLTQASDDDRGGTLIQVDPDPPAGARSWSVVEGTVRTATEDLQLSRGTAIYGLDVADGDGTVTLILHRRGSEPDRDLFATGRPGEAVWTTRVADTATLGLPRVIAHAARGSATLYHEPVRGQWKATVSGAEGTAGEGLLTSVGTSGLIETLAIAADGHLWLGGARGLWRSAEPLR